MLRTLICGLVAFGLCSGAALAADQKADKKAAPGKTVNGKLVKIDAAAGTLTLSVKAKGENEAKEQIFQIDDTTKVNVWVDEKKTELTGKDGLKNEQFKTGTTVRVTTNEAGKVTVIGVGMAPKKKKN